MPMGQPTLRIDLASAGSRYVVNFLAKPGAIMGLPHASTEARRRIDWLPPLMSATSDNQNKHGSSCQPDISVDGRSVD
jgi:hypothetical protein